MSLQMSELRGEEDGVFFRMEGRSWRRLEERDCGAVFRFREIDLI